MGMFSAERTRSAKKTLINLEASMKMLKTLLLGSAAGLAAVVGAQAADLPVKAKPVRYVKICSLYGDGFYYIPGTDTCIKFSGYVRADYGYKVSVNAVNYSGDAGARDRNASLHPFNMRARARFEIDTRSQTAYGTVRAYESMNFENKLSGGSLGQNTFALHRAFIQWAGFTFGHTESFTDPAAQFEDKLPTLHGALTEAQTAGGGINQIAYTWEVGNGITFNVGADEKRQLSLYLANNNAAGTITGTRIGGTPASLAAGQNWPDPWVALRVTQAWGSASVAFIAQQNRGVYYTSTAACAGGQLGTTQCPYPDDKWGWAVLSGAEIKLPMIAPGDRLLVQANYSEGAPKLALPNLSSPSLFGSGNTVAIGWVTDAAYINGGAFQLTTAWGTTAGIEHYWTRNFASTLWGGYAEVSYNNTVVNGGWFCSAAQVTPLSGQACDPGFKVWQIGSAGHWFPVKGLRLAVETVYTNINTAMAGLANIGQTRGNRPTGIYNVKDVGIYTVMFRAQRNF
jgi:Porin subfamily